MIPIYDGTNDISKWRLDLLYGPQVIDPHALRRAFRQPVMSGPAWMYRRG